MSRSSAKPELAANVLQGGETFRANVALALAERLERLLVREHLERVLDRLELLRSEDHGAGAAVARDHHVLVPPLDLVEQIGQLRAGLGEGDVPCHEIECTDFGTYGQDAGRRASIVATVRTRVLDLGWREARRLGHHWVGDEHILIGLSRSAGPAGKVLREAGATPERLDAQLEQSLAECDPPLELREAEWLTFTPAAHTTLGRAEGFALARGVQAPDEGLLLASVLWRATGSAAAMLRQLGVDRAELVEKLAAYGVPVPDGVPDPDDLRPRRRIEVPFDRLMEIVRELSARLPADGRFGFNHDGRTRAWIFVGDDEETGAIVVDVLAGSE